MKVFVSAAEISSDIHAEKIVRSLIQLYEADGKKIEVAGVGGPRLRSIPGFQSLQAAEELRAMGFVEVLGKISLLKKIQRKLLAYIDTEAPDLIITFDYPDFHLRLLEQVQKRKLAPRALRVCAIPPKVWVWRAHRVEQIRRLYHGVLVIFPFEKSFYGAKGIPVISEGNPLIANLLAPATADFTGDASLGTNAEPLHFGNIQNTAQNNIGVRGDQSVVTTVLTVMPGSRDAELKYHLPLISPTLEILAKKLNHSVKALVPVPVGVELEKIKSVLVNSSRVQYEFKIDGAKECLKASSVGLIKSGTATLEAAVLGCVPVIFYKTNKITEWIFRLIVRYTGPVGLPNILLGATSQKEAPFPEFLGPDATPEKLAAELFRLATHTPEREAAQNNASKLKMALVPTDQVSLQIAKKLMAWQTQRPFSYPAHRTQFFIGMASFLWSTLNFLRREIFSAEPETFSVPSVLFGNIQAGGSGKTPLLIEFAQYSIVQGKRVAVVTRGYRGAQENSINIILPSVLSISPAEYGDEPAEIKKRVPSAYLAIGADRLESVHALLKTAQEKRDPIEVILFDDGFQNLKFEATVNVLCVTDQLRDEMVYRDFESNLEDADFIVGTKGTDFSRYEKAFPKIFHRITWESRDLPVLPIWLLTGVANPSEVRNFYAAQGVQVQKLIAKPDHAVFNAAEVKKLMREAAITGAMLAVTEKDFVKLAPLGIASNESPLSTQTTVRDDRVLVLTRQLSSDRVLKLIDENLQR
jgi:lipid-A-disaccharide synthase